VITSQAVQILSEDADYLFLLSPNAAIYSSLQCVTANGGGSYTATFGYNNLNSTSVTIPSGTSNFISPPSAGVALTTFQPGVNAGVFNVSFSGGYLFWTLQGPDGVSRTASASISSTACVSRGS
jgi:hypothetical protein